MGQLFSSFFLSFFSFYKLHQYKNNKNHYTTRNDSFNVHDHDGHANDRANKMLHHGCDCDHDVRILVSAKDN